jgi:hypothetical protein
MALRSPVGERSRHTSIPLAPFRLMWEPATTRESATVRLAYALRYSSVKGVES